MEKQLNHSLLFQFLYFLNYFNSIEIYKGLKNEIAFITKK